MTSQQWVKLSVRSVLVCLSLSFAGCSAGDEQSAPELAQVGKTEQALNCVAQCVQIYRACRASGGDAEGCAAERESCKEECDALTCEPSDPGCCQGQPTCW